MTAQHEESPTNKHPSADADTLRFDDRVVVVTGSGRGMGRAHAHLLAARGARVVVSDLGISATTGEGTSTDVAERVAAEIVAAGGTALATTESVATESGAAAIVATAIERWGRLDALVHNAGISAFDALENLTYETYRRTMAVHLDGAFLLTRAAWPHMCKQGSGRLLFISSSSASLGQPLLGAYAMAKAGMIGLMNVAKLEGRAFGINANVLGVAAYTRMTQSLFQSNASAGDTMEQWWQAHLRPELVSPVVAWLVHESCPVTGEIYETRGGTVAQMFIATTRGYTNLDLTPEDVRDHLDEIRRTDGYRVFGSAIELAEYQFAEMVRSGVPGLGADTPSRTIS